MPITSKKVTYEFSPEELQNILVNSLGIPLDKKTVEVSFDIQEKYDPMDRGPGIPFLKAIKVIVQDNG